MTYWAKAHRLGPALGVLLLLGLASLLLGDHGLPVVTSSATGSPVPALALLPAVAASLLVTALRPPWPQVDATFSRGVAPLRAAWLILGSVVGWAAVALSTSSESPFGLMDLARNNMLFLLAAGISYSVWGYAGSWVLPLLLVLGAFVPGAGEAHRWWAVIVWSGSGLVAVCVASLAAGLACLPLVLATPTASPR